MMHGRLPVASPVAGSEYPRGEASPLCPLVDGCHRVASPDDGPAGSNARIRRKRLGVTVHPGKSGEDRRPDALAEVTRMWPGTGNWTQCTLSAAPGRRPRPICRHATVRRGEC